VRRRQIVTTVLSALGATVFTAAAAAAYPACVSRTLTPSPALTNTYESCVLDEQVLLNNLYHAGLRPPYVAVPANGHYGPLTAGDVGRFNRRWLGTDAGVTYSRTWDELCKQNQAHGFRGDYWRTAGCNLVPAGA